MRGCPSLDAPPPTHTHAHCPRVLLLLLLQGPDLAAALVSHPTMTLEEANRAPTVRSTKLVYAILRTLTTPTPGEVINTVRRRRRPAPALRCHAARSTPAPATAASTAADDDAALHQHAHHARDHAR